MAAAPSGHGEVETYDLVTLVLGPGFSWAAPSRATKVHSSFLEDSRKSPRKNQGESYFPGAAPYSRPCRLPSLPPTSGRRAAAAWIQPQFRQGSSYRDFARGGGGWGQEWEGKSTCMQPPWGGGVELGDGVGCGPTGPTLTGSNQGPCDNQSILVTTNTSVQTAQHYLGLAH